MHQFIAANHLASDRYQDSFQKPFWHDTFLEKRCWLWAIAILQRGKKKMKSEGDEYQPPRNPHAVYARDVCPAGLLMREIKICTHLVGYVTTGLIKRAWIQSQEIWVALACPLHPSMCQMTLGQSLPMSKIPHPIQNERINSSTASSWEGSWPVLQFTCYVYSYGSSCLLRGFPETRMH